MAEWQQAVGLLYRFRAVWDMEPGHTRVGRKGRKEGSPRAPVGTPSVFCPWCNNNFPVAGNTSDPIAALREADRKKAKQKKLAEEETKQGDEAKAI